MLRSPFLGLTVRRGPDWDWGDQDGGGLGVTVAEGEVHTSDWVQVRRCRSVSRHRKMEENHLILGRFGWIWPP